jgi:hypothetical protein
MHESKHFLPGQFAHSDGYYFQMSAFMTIVMAAVVLAMNIFMNVLIVRSVSLALIVRSTMDVLTTLAVTMALVSKTETMGLPVPVLVSIGVKHVNTIAVVQIHVVMVHVRILEMAATTARVITDIYYQIVRLSVSVALFQEFVKMVELVSTKR